MVRGKEQEREQERTRRRSWLFWTGIVASALVLAALIAGVKRANPPFPAPPAELEQIRLELPAAGPVSAALGRLLDRERHRAYDLTVPALREARAALHRGSWLEDPGQVLEAIGALEDPRVEAFRRELLAPGCLPRRDPPLALTRTDPLVLLRGVEALTLRSVALTQQGRVAPAIAELSALQRRLLRLQQRCAKNLLLTLVVEVCLDTVHRAWGYVVAGGLPRDVERRVWRQITAVEAAGNPMPDTMRAEHAWSAAMIDLVRRQPGSDQRSTWPWYDEQDTLRILRAISRRHVWLASQPVSSKAWTRALPEVVYMKRLHESPGWLGYLRYNSVGKLMLSASTMLYRRHLLKWHRGRCLVAARRAGWIARIRARGRQLPAVALRPQPRDPFTGKVIDGSDEAGVHCAVRREVTRDGMELEGSTVAGLPPYPPPAGE